MLLAELLLSKGGILHHLLVVVNLVLLQRHDVLLTHLLLVGQGSSRVLLVINDNLLTIRRFVCAFGGGLRRLLHLLVARLHLNEALNESLRVNSGGKHALLCELHDFFLLLSLLMV